VRFSQRLGYTEIRVQVQRESIDSVLRTKLWSALHLAVFDPDERYLQREGVDAEAMAQRLGLYFFHNPVDKTPAYRNGAFALYVRNWFFKCQWYDVYDFLEALLAELDGEPARNLVGLTNSY
jgi:hypothetical protein